MNKLDFEIQVALEKIFFDNGIIRYDILVIDPVSKRWLEDKRIIRVLSSIVDINTIYDNLLNAIIRQYGVSPIDYLSKSINESSSTVSFRLDAT